MAMRKPARGEIWESDLNPSRGHEQSGTRPVLIVSVDPFNQGPSELVIVVPISTKDKKVRSQVPIEQGEGGLKTKSFIKCEAIRSISTERLRSRWGTASRETMSAVEDRLRILMNL
ncbi:MAG: type II toxin-antitoxin system PemK/MazF family toxin [Isosphaerales bacterium]